MDGRKDDDRAGPSSLARNGASSLSPAPASASSSCLAAPRKKHNLTPAEMQARHLEKLLADPTKPVHIPKPIAEEKTLRAPREMMKSVSGSSAGAGSGDFHVYKHARRREYERIKLMEEAAERERQAKEYEQKQARVQSEISAKTSKNRAKRDKKKQAKMAAKGAAADGEQRTAGSAGNGTDKQRDSAADDEDDTGVAQKRKRINAEGTAQVVFQRPASDSGDDSDEGTK